MKKQDRMANKKLPKKVNIGGLWFKIKYYDEMPKEIKTELGNDCVGYCDFEHREIALLKKVARRDHVCLIHEVIHACVDSICPESARWQKELFVRPFAQMLYGALDSIGAIKNPS